MRGVPSLKPFLLEHLPSFIGVILAGCLGGFWRYFPGCKHLLRRRADGYQRDGVVGSWCCLPRCS